MNGTSLLSGTGTSSMDGLGKLCIFGCKKQREADRAKAAALLADKNQALKLEEQRQMATDIAQQNADAIAQAEAKTKKTTVILYSVGGAVVVAIGIALAVKSRKK
jgi:hypothetical protein